MLRVKALAVALLAGVVNLLSCSSEPINGDNEAGSATDPGGSAGTTSACSAALRQQLSLVDEVSTATVSVLSGDAADRTIYVDASVGGLNGQDTHPWIYVKLSTAAAVAVTDLEALASSDWDLAFKRSMIRSNGGDSGPGRGGAIRIALPWDEVDETTLGQKTLPTEQWFDADCKIELDASMNLVTTFSGWSEYDEVNHVLSAAPDVVFITAAAGGSLYKVAILDYYSTPSGAHGTVSGRYKVRIAPLP